MGLNCGRMVEGENLVDDKGLRQQSSSKVRIASFEETVSLAGNITKELHNNPGGEHVIALNYKEFSGKQVNRGSIDERGNELEVQEGSKDHKILTKIRGALNVHYILWRCLLRKRRKRGNGLLSHLVWM